MKVQTKKANKDYPQFGIAKGDIYYQWAFFRQQPIKSKTYPTRAQLTQNEVLGAVYAVYDGLPLTNADDVETVAQTVREAGEEAVAKRDNMPEGLQEGETGQRLQDWADACAAAADELDGIVETLREEEERVMPEKPDQEAGEKDEDYEARLDALLDEAGVSGSAEYYSLDRDVWTWELDSEALNEAVSGTEPSLD